MNPKKNIVLSIQAHVSQMEMNVPADQVDKELAEIRETMRAFFQNVLFGGELKEEDKLEVQVSIED
jgi:hypothetical protein